MEAQRFPSSQAADLMVSGLWLNPGEISKLHRRLKRTRTKTSKACAHCRKNKHGCDENRPCSRCTRKGLTCVADDENSEILLESHTKSQALAKRPMLERPIASRGTLLLSERGNNFLRQRGMQLPSHVSQIHWMMGHNECDLVHMIKETPPVLLPIARAAMAAVKILMTPTKPEPEDGALNLLSQHMTRNPEASVPFEKAEVKQPDTSVFCMWMDKAALVREGVAVGGHNTLSLIAGVHPEEVCARVANHEVPIPITQIEGFCHIMDDLLNGMDPCVVRYVKWKPRFMSEDTSQHVGCNFIRWTRFNSKEDSELDIWQMKSQMELISPQEYEAARLAQPDICRPLTHLLGDDRCALDLQHHDESLDTWQGWMSSESGRQRVYRFAAELRKRFAPVIKMAELMSGVNIWEEVEAADVQSPSALTSPMASDGSTPGPVTPPPAL